MEIGMAREELVQQATRSDRAFRILADIGSGISTDFSPEAGGMTDKLGFGAGLESTFFKRAHVCWASTTLIP